MTKPAVLIINHATAILEDRLFNDCQLICRGDTILHVGKPKGKVPAGAVVLNARGKYVAPGFIDIHVHGGGGADFMDGTVEAVQVACQAHARHGTTSLFPTTTTGSVAQLDRMLDAVGQAQRSHQTQFGARIPGVHLYGPFFAPDKIGCHPSSGVRPPSLEEFQRYLKTKLIRIATCAAELPGAGAFYRLAKRQRCLITCGHSNSSWGEMAQAYRAGMRHVDHFWCAMSSVASVRSRLGTPMQGSMLEFVLAHPEMSTEVIADGYHLAPELLEFAWQMKTAKKLCLVTDSNRGMDLPAGEYTFGAPEDGTKFIHDGFVGRTATGALASSVQGMDHMVRQMATTTRIPLHEVVRMASLTPAELTGIDTEYGSLKKGKRADLVILNRKLQVQNVFIGGVKFR